VALITHKVVNDEGGKVKKAARIACNFWNRFVGPRKSIVIRLGVFDEDSDTIAPDAAVGDAAAQGARSKQTSGLNLLPATGVAGSGSADGASGDDRAFPVERLRRERLTRWHDVLEREVVHEPSQGGGWGACPPCELPVARCGSIRGRQG
jgi:hypothetical protein